MTVVVDASVVVAALVDAGGLGGWSRSVLADNDLVAPHHVLVESAHALRRLALRSQVSDEDAEHAHRALLLLPFDLTPYELVAERAWELRSTVTPYDAWYVALAERRGAPLATLDARLSRAVGPACRFLHPD